MIAQSQSGTGKTAVFVLTMLSRVNPEHAYTQVFTKVFIVFTKIFIVFIKAFIELTPVFIFRYLL